MGRKRFLAGVHVFSVSEDDEGYRWLVEEAQRTNESIGSITRQALRRERKARKSWFYKKSGVR